MEKVLTTYILPSKASEGITNSATATKENIATVIKGVKIEAGKLTAIDGYQFIVSKDEKSVSLQKMKTIGVSSIAGIFEYTCFGNPNSCNVTVTDNRTINLSTSCEGCSLVATVNNTKYLIRLN